jgi:hypothetical protein
MILRMSAAQADPPLLDAEHAAFILLPGISMTAASRDAQLAPSLGRAVGCRVAADRSRVTVLIPADQNAELMEALRATRTIAVVFSQPSTHRTIQLKGRDAAIAPADADDAALAARWSAGFVAELSAYGYVPGLVSTFVWCDPAQLAAVTFSPCAAFQQTPGPRAGTPLSP